MKEITDDKRSIVIKTLIVVTILYAILSFTCGCLMVMDDNLTDAMEHMMIPLSVGAVVLAILYVKILQLKYPEIIKPFCSAMIVLSFVYPRAFLPQAEVLFLNYVIDSSTVILAVWYLIAARKQKGKKWSMIMCVIIGIFLLLTDMISIV